MNPESVNSSVYMEQYVTFNLKKFFSRIFRKAHWFAISILTGFSIAYLYNHYAAPEYNVHSSMIVNEYESGIKRLNISPGDNNERNINVLGQDHAGRIKSHKLCLNTLQSLNWNVSWYKETILYNKDLYENEPYQVNPLTDKKNLTAVPVYIRQISDSVYTATVETTTQIGGINIPVAFSAVGKFGVPFKNNYFSFILSKVEGRSGYQENIYFVINNLNILALKYQRKLKVIINEKKPDLIELVLSENHTQRGVDFLNKLEQTYIDYGLAEKNRVAENTIKFIDNQLKNVTDSLSASEKMFTNFRTRTQSVDISQAGGMVMQKQVTLESEKAVLENRLKYLKDLLTDMNDSRQMKQVVVPSVYGITDQTLNTLVTKLSDLYSRREVLSFSVQEKAPSLILLDKEIKFTHNLLANIINNLLSATETDLENLSRRNSGFSSQLSILPRNEQKLSSLKRNFDLNNDLYTYLLKMRAESAITYASNQPDVKVLDPARIETANQTSPMTITNYLLGIIMGFLFPLGFILFHDYINGSIQSKEEVEEVTSLPVVGMVSHNRGKKDMVVFESPRSNITESFRLLRTNLKYLLDGADKKVIAVQSAVSGEGKSFISLNLASILALNNYKVLLVGIDMRRSSLHTILKSDNIKGISTYLSNQDKFDDILETTQISNLSYISSGPFPPNPAELLENGRFEGFMTEAKSRFDYIILDSPPVLLVADGFITGRQADLNLFVVRLRYSSKDQFQSINKQEIRKALPNMALVLNDAISENYGSGKYYNNRYKNYYEE